MATAKKKRAAKKSKKAAAAHMQRGTGSPYCQKDVKQLVVFMIVF